MAKVNIVIEGDKELIRTLKRLDKSIRGKAALRAVNAGAAVLQRKTKINMDKVLRRRSGNLINSIIVRSHSVGEGAEAIIKIGSKYSAIHEFGGTILPKNAKALHWKVNGQDIFAKKVIIPERPYFRPAIEEGKDEIANAMESALIDAIREGGPNGAA